MLRAWYESRQTDAVRLATIPDANDSVLLLSHDVDWENSFAPMLDFAAMEEKHHAKSTFFIQTKYVSDANSAAFFFGKDLDDLREALLLGFFNRQPFHHPLARVQQIRIRHRHRDAGDV